MDASRHSLESFIRSLRIQPLAYEAHLQWHSLPSAWRDSIPYRDAFDPCKTPAQGKGAYQLNSRLPFATS
jgi:hypothetical protein